MAMETPISYKFISIRSMILLGCEQPSPLHLSPCTDPRGGKKKKHRMLSDLDKCRQALCGILQPSSTSLQASLCQT